MTDPQKDEHIEELLSKLQGIFGKLSHSEEEEGKQEIEVPAPAPAPKPASPPTFPPTMPPAQVVSPSKPVSPPPATPVPTPIPEATPMPTHPTPAPGSPIEPAAAPVTTSLSGYESMVPVQDPEKMIVPTGIYFPPGREGEAKALAQKLETMTPKFTKVAFRLRVIVFSLYDPKSEWKDDVLAKGAECHFQTVFVLMDRPFDDTKRKAVTAEFEGRGFYFQEVLTMLIEKKAFYTDVLLGLVFFFDSHKPAAGTQEQTP
jgi:hypothetical protein